MVFSGVFLGALIAACFALVLNILLRKRQLQIPLAFWYLLWILPFLTGGFYAYVAAVTAGMLLVALCRAVSGQKPLVFSLNLSTAACFAVAAAYCITPLWAADKGMAAFGVLRYLPVAMLAVLLMQYTGEQKLQFLQLLPACGAVITIVGCILWSLPNTSQYVSVNGRLSGFFQYPNTFAGFLLTGIAVLCAKEKGKKSDYLLLVTLAAGVFLSGSRTGVFFLIIVLLGALVVRKKISPVVFGMVMMAGGIAFALLIRSGERITILGRDIGSLFVRVLYYKDALPVILRHPFGLGYLGYRALETTFQTSRYTVSFVHSSLLQLLLDIGWIPTLLLFGCIGKTMVSRKGNRTSKFVLLVLVGHSLIDFDFQFFLFWAVLLLCLDFEEGKQLQLRKGKRPALAVAIAVFLVCMWLGAGDFFFRIGRWDTALKVTPFYTDAIESELKETTDPDELDQLADKILRLNPTHALAYSAKANAAFSRGNVMDMVSYKETAIRYTPYSVEEYCDYIEKLYVVMELYQKSGDHDSAEFCLKKMLSIPEMMEKAEAKTDPLAYQTGNSTEIVLPDAYRQLLKALAEAYSMEIK